MLKSVVDSAPILFVKLGQDTAGAIDFKITSKSSDSSFTKVPINYYNIDPFVGLWSLPPDPEQN